MAENQALIKEVGKYGLNGPQVANLTKGGQLGVGFLAHNFDAATPVTFTPAVIVVLATPTMWRDSEAGVMLKNMVESHAKTFTGIDVEYTLETQSQVVGNDGQEMETPTKTKRAAVNPSATYPEVNGNLVWDFHRQWMFDINHPDTNVFASGMDKAPAFVRSAYSMTILCIQFGPDQRPENIIDGTIISNMFPKTIGPFGMERTIGNTKIQERTVTYSGYQQHSDETRRIAIKVAEALLLHLANYDDAKGVSEAVDSKIKNAGLAQDIETVKGQA